MDRCLYIKIRRTGCERFLSHYFFFDFLEGFSEQVPLGQLFKSWFHVLRKPRRPRTRFWSVLLACWGRRTTNKALCLIECFPCIFIVGNLDDVGGSPHLLPRGFSEYIATLFGHLKNNMSSVSKQPWRLILTRIPRSRDCVRRDDGLNVRMECKRIVIE